MPKTKQRESVVHDWVQELTFQQQALLMTAMRGPDACTKHNVAKMIVRYLRGVVLKPAGDWSGFNDNDFMWGDYSESLFIDAMNTFCEEHDEYPHHFIMHLAHCAEVVGYKHPDVRMRFYWGALYRKCCLAFHMKSETEEEMDKRLNDFGCGYVKD